MIVAAISRQSNKAECGWEYESFPDMEYFLDWVMDRRSGPAGIEKVWEFVGGFPHEDTTWEAQLAELQRSAEADHAHKVRWMHPGPL